jgi:2-C-methyl-D-erythritol 4-phosphate cytidylyltransferase
LVVLRNVDPQDVSALVPAAGSGDRLGLGPKAFLELDGRPLLAWIADKVRRVAGEVLIAVPANRLVEARELCTGCTCIAGGATRQETVARLVEISTRPLILIQDAARPFASVALLREVCFQAQVHGVAGAFLSPGVPVARIDADGWVAQAFPARGSAIFQAPQAFRRDILKGVLDHAAREGWDEQSTMQLVLRLGIPVRAVPGEVRNLKVTTPEDWQLARRLEEFLT